jgi:hypothetical protein
LEHGKGSEGFQETGYLTNLRLFDSCEIRDDYKRMTGRRNGEPKENLFRLIDNFNLSLDLICI